MVDPGSHNTNPAATLRAGRIDLAEPGAVPGSVGMPTGAESPGHDPEPGPLPRVGILAMLRRPRQPPGSRSNGTLRDSSQATVPGPAAVGVRTGASSRSPGPPLRRTAGLARRRPHGRAFGVVA